MIIDQYNQFGGIHPETASVTNILAAQDFRAANSGEPFSEAMIFGIAGGLGCGYILWEFKKYESAILVLGFQNKWNYPVEFFSNLSSRLSVKVEFRETGGKKTAAKHLAEAIDSGQAVVAWVDQESLPYFHLRPMYNGCFGHYVSVYGLQEDLVYIDDRARKPFMVDADSFAAARGRIGSYKNKLLLLDSRGAEADLPAAIMAGLEDCVNYMSSGSQTFAPPVYRKWARLMTDEKNKKGWPVVFKERTGLYSTLRSLHEGIKLFGTKGGGLRFLYADFLQEAAGVLPNPTMSEAAGQYRALGEMWSQFADSVLPDEIPVLAETRRLLAEKYASFLANGGERQEETAAISQQLVDMEAELNPILPIDEIQMAEIFAGMQADISQIYKAELAALETLKACLA